MTSESSNANFMNLCCLALLIATTVYGALKYSGLPDTIPIHFNGAGNPDGYGPKSTLWIFCGIMWFTYFIMKWSVSFTTKSKPETLRKWNTGYRGLTDEQITKYSRYLAEMVNVMNVFITTILAYIFYKMIRIASGAHADLGAWLLPVIIIGIGIPIIKMLLYRSKIKSL